MRVFSELGGREVGSKEAAGEGGKVEPRKMKKEKTSWMLQEKREDRKKRSFWRVDWDDGG